MKDLKRILLVCETIVSYNKKSFNLFNLNLSSFLENICLAC